MAGRYTGHNYCVDEDDPDFEAIHTYMEYLLSTSETNSEHQVTEMEQECPRAAGTGYRPLQSNEEIDISHAQNLEQLCSSDFDGCNTDARREVDSSMTDMGRAHCGNTDVCSGNTPAIDGLNNVQNRIEEKFGQYIDAEETEETLLANIIKQHVKEYAQKRNLAQSRTVSRGRGLGLRLNIGSGCGNGSTSISLGSASSGLGTGSNGLCSDSQIGRGRCRGRGLGLNLGSVNRRSNVYSLGIPRGFGLGLGLGCGRGRSRSRGRALGLDLDRSISAYGYDSGRGTLNPSPFAIVNVNQKIVAGNGKHLTADVKNDSGQSQVIEEESCQSKCNRTDKQDIADIQDTLIMPDVRTVRHSEGSLQVPSEQQKITIAEDMKYVPLVVENSVEKGALKTQGVHGSGSEPSGQRVSIIDGSLLDTIIYKQTANECDRQAEENTESIPNTDLPKTLLFKSNSEKDQTYEQQTDSSLSSRTVSFNYSNIDLIASTLGCIRGRSYDISGNGRGSGSGHSQHPNRDIDGRMKQFPPSDLVNFVHENRVSDFKSTSQDVKCLKTNESTHSAEESVLTLDRTEFNKDQPESAGSNIQDILDGFLKEKLLYEKEYSGIDEDSDSSISMTTNIHELQYCDVEDKEKCQNQFKHVEVSDVEKIAATSAPCLTKQNSSEIVSECSKQKESPDSESSLQTSNAEESKFEQCDSTQLIGDIWSNDEVIPIVTCKIKEQLEKPQGVVQSIISVLKPGVSGVLQICERNNSQDFIATLICDDQFQQYKTLISPEFSEECESLPYEKFNPQIKDLVLAYSESEDSWIRAFVVNATHNGYIVASSETGLLEKVQQVKQLPRKYQEIVTFAVHCCIKEFVIDEFIDIVNVDCEFPIDVLHTDHEGATVNLKNDGEVICILDVRTWIPPYHLY